MRTVVCEFARISDFLRLWTNKIIFAVCVCAQLKLRVCLYCQTLSISLQYVLKRKLFTTAFADCVCV